MYVKLILTNGKLIALGLANLSSTVNKTPLDGADRDKAHKCASVIGQKVDFIQSKVTGSSPVANKVYGKQLEYI